MHGKSQRSFPRTQQGLKVVIQTVMHDILQRDSVLGCTGVAFSCVIRTVMGVRHGEGTRQGDLNQEDGDRLEQGQKAEWCGRGALLGAP